MPSAAQLSPQIEQFLHEIERTMKGITKSREIVTKGISPEFQFEMRRLLLIACAACGPRAIPPGSPDQTVTEAMRQATTSTATAAIARPRGSRQ